MDTSIIILNILAIFCAICMSERILVNTFNSFKWKFNMTEMYKNRIDTLKIRAIKNAIIPLSERTKRVCWYMALGTSWASFVALLYKAFVQ